MEISADNSEIDIRIRVVMAMDACVQIKIGYTVVSNRISVFEDWSNYLIHL
jgi:hypothetical protein